MIPFEDGAVVELGLVGARDYFRAIDLVASIDCEPGDRLDIRFLRPLSGEIMLRAVRPADPLASLVRIRGAERQVLYATAGEGPGRVARPDIRPSGMVAPVKSHRLIAILSWRARPPLRALDHLFEVFQATFQRRFMLLRLTIRVLPHALGVVTARPQLSAAGELVGCVARHNGRDWCVMRIAPRRSGGPVAQRDIAGDEQGLV